MITEISSLQHPLVKKWVKLRSEKSDREAEGAVLLSGEKLVRDVAKKIPLQVLISVTERPEIAAEKRYVVTEEILRKVTGVMAPDGIAAVAAMPKESSLEGKKRILVLDRISDPGNLGTLLRSALALNWDGVFLTRGTVDPFNDKALRASQGALFFLPYAQGERFVGGERYVYLADLEGTRIERVMVKTPLALILSHEGSGPSDWAEVGTEKVTIAMHNGVDSLNVASSGAIFLYVMGGR